MPLSRRNFLAGSGALVAAGWSLRLWTPERQAAMARTLRVAAAPAGTTLEASIVPVGSGAYRRLGEGPGWPSLVRTDLAPAAEGREDRRRPLAAFVHLTDMHLIDAQSTGRVEFLDPADAVFQSAFRPQEALSTQVATSMVQRLNGLAGGPITGRPLDAAVSTGDNIDNQQRNEMRWFVDVLDGGRIVPDSGAVGAYEGPQDQVSPQPRYWHPDGGASDDYKAAGYPTIPGLLDRAVAPFESPGLTIPWYSVYGNHDCNVQGNASRSDALDEVFAGDRKMTGLKSGEGAVPFILRVFYDSPSVLADLRAGRIPFREVTADEGRRTATVHDWVQAHLSSPTGTHGYDAADLDAGRLHYEFELAPGVVGISLDSTNHAGGVAGSDGSIGQGQLDWLEERLAANSSRHVDRDGFLVRSGSVDKVVVVFSHHTSTTMDAGDPDPARPGERRVKGDEVVATLLRYPNVVAWVNGHTHTNSVVAHRDPAGHTGGFWEISTASHIDYPQQSRVIELVDNGDRTLSVHCTIVEHAGPAAADHQAADPVGLSSISRELGFNDAQAGPLAKLGDAASHNVELVVAAPAITGVGERPAAPPAAVPEAVPAQPVTASAGFTG